MYYDNMIIIPEENWSIFKNHRKTNLNVLERIGLESVACDFIHEYEESAFGDVYSKNISDYIRVLSDSGTADILDGVYDTYEFDGMLICDFWTTENGCLMLTAVKIPENCENWQDHDWLYNDEFEEVLIRLY